VSAAAPTRSPAVGQALQAEQRNTMQQVVRIGRLRTATAGGA
jgi:hypothetical protein